MRAGTSKAATAQRKALFIEAYIANGGNATAAAKTAGFSEKTAYSQGQRLLKVAEVAAAIEMHRKEKCEQAGLTTERTLREIARLSYFDFRKLYDEAGNLKKPHQLDDDTAAAVAGMEVDEIGVEGTVVGHTRKYKYWDKNTALDKAMKYQGLFEADNQQKPPPTVNVGELTVSLDFDRVLARAKSAVKRT